MRCRNGRPGLIETTARTAVIAAAPIGGKDLLDQLERLGQLKSAGVLDDAEFAAAKARLLAN